MSSWAVEDGIGLRSYSAADFPLAIGGEDADVALPSSAQGDAIAFLGLDGGEIFVQPAEGVDAVCNGAALEASRWLQSGDILRFGSDRIRVEGGPGALKLRVDGRGASAEIQPPPRPPQPAAGGAIRPVEFRPSSLRPRKVRRLPRGRSFLVAVLFFVVALVGALLFTSRSVQIEIEPAAESFEVSGGILPIRVFGRHLLLPGDWVVRAEKEGYRPLEQVFRVDRETSQRFHFELEELPGILVVTVPGVEAAAIWVDGVLQGEAPLELELERGDHELAFRAVRFQDAFEQVTIEGMGREQELRVELTPGWAPVSFESDPPGATVVIDGSQVGLTPLTAEVSAGNRQVEITKPGYLSHRMALRVNPAEAQMLPPVALRAAPGKLAVESRPAGATVMVNGEFRGATPLELSLEPARSHELVLRRSGFEPAIRTVAIRAGQREDLEVELAARVGEIALRVWPNDAEVVVNGALLESPPEVLSLPAALQTIEVRKQGYAAVSRQVTPVPGLRQTVEITLETQEAIADRESPLVLRAAEGHELRRIEGGSLRMGAPRREPGRRANEAFREVELTRRFYLATQEVSNAQFRRFRSGHRSGAFGEHNLELDHHPAVRISWDDAVAYCNWLSKKDGLPEFYRRVGGHFVASEPLNHGYRLPTEAEWVWAARYPEGRQARKYPWGDDLPVPDSAGNYGDATASGLLASAIPSYTDGYATTSPTDAFAPNERGIYDLDGNVAEWVHDYYAVSSTFGKPAEKDPMGPDVGTFHVIRGSSWMHDSVTELRWSYRDYGQEPRPDLGFRIARYVQ